MNKTNKYSCGVLLVVLVSIAYMIIDFKFTLNVYYVIKNVLTVNAIISFTILYSIGTEINLITQRK